MGNSAGKLARSAIVWLVCILTAVYMLNPGAGKKELLPDDMQFFGNLDELVAALILLSGLRYFGLDVVKFFAREPGE